MTTLKNITESQILSLQQEAASAGDTLTANDCARALVYVRWSRGAGVIVGHSACRRVVKVIRDAEDAKRFTTKGIRRAN
jgi:hypothetical protein